MRQKDPKKIKVFIQKDKPDAQGKAPLFLKFMIKGEVGKVTFTKVKVYPESWDQKLQIVLPSGKYENGEANKLNELISFIYKKNFRKDAFNESEGRDELTKEWVSFKDVDLQQKTGQFIKHI